LAHKKKSKAQKSHYLKKPNKRKPLDFFKNLFDDNKQRSKSLNEPELKDEFDPNQNADYGNYIIKS
jgi:hypothetical protein